MPKGRVWPIILIAIGLGLVLLVCAKSPLFKTEDETTLPVDLQNVIHRPGRHFPNNRVSADYDRDGENEWLILFRYNTTTVQPPISHPTPMCSAAPSGSRL